MVKLDIRNQSRVSEIDKLVEYLYKHGNNPPTLNIEKEGNDLMVRVYWTDDYGWGSAKSYYLYYKVEGLKDLIGSFLDDYTTTNLDAKLVNYTNTTDLNTKLSDYTKTAKLDTKLSDYTKTADLNTKLSDYINTAKLDTKLSDYTKTADLNTKLSDYINTAKLDTKLSDYTKIAKLDTKLSDYTRTDGSNITDDIQNKLMSHHTAQVFDFFSNLETEYNAMHG